MDTLYSLQTNNAVVSPSQIERSTTSGKSSQDFNTSFRIKIVGLKNNSNNISFTKEDNGVTEEEERNYYKKTLKSKLL